MNPNRQNAAAKAFAWAQRADELTEAALAERTAAAITPGSSEDHLDAAADLTERAEEAREMVATWAMVAPLLEPATCPATAVFHLWNGPKHLGCIRPAGHTEPDHRDVDGAVWAPLAGPDHPTTETS